MLQVKLFAPNPEIYTAIAQIYNAENPDNPERVENFKQYDNQPHSLCRNPRFVAELDGQVIVEASCIEMQPGTFFYRYSVLPAYESLNYDGKSIHGHLYDFALKILQPRKPQQLQINVIEDKRGRIQFLCEQGFEITKQTQLATLNVSEFDPRQLVDSVANIEKLDYDIVALPKLQSFDSDWKSKLYALHEDIARDIPPLMSNQMSIQQFDTLLRHPRFCADVWFIGLKDNEYVGLSYLWATADPKIFFTGTTGVRRGHRRRGIATALKMSTIRFVQGENGLYIETENDTKNGPILDLNRKLGFMHKPALLEFKKQIHQPWQTT